MLLSYCAELSPCAIIQTGGGTPDVHKRQGCTHPGWQAGIATGNLQVAASARSTQAAAAPTKPGLMLGGKSLHLRLTLNLPGSHAAVSNIC